MHLIKILTYLRKAGLTLWTDGVRLKVKTREEHIDSALMHLLRAHKKEIIAHLIKARDLSVNDTGQLPASVAQREKYLNQNFLPQKVIGHHIAQFRLEYTPSPAHLEKTLLCLAQRHPILRARLQKTDKGLFISSYQAAPPTLTIVDLHHLSQRRKTHLMSHLVDTLRNHGGPYPRPLSAHLFRLGQGLFIFCIRLHQFFADTYSAKLFLSEWKHAYSTISQGKEPCFDRRVQSFRDALTWEALWLDHPDYQKELKIATRKLRYLDRNLNLPYDFPRQQRQSNKCNRFYFNLSPKLSTALSELAQNNHSSVEMIMLTAYASALSALTLQQTFIMAVPNFQRGHRWPNTLAQLGDMALLPIETRNYETQEPLPFDQLLQRLSQAFQQLNDTPWLPFPSIMRALRERPQKNRHPLTQVGFFFSYRDSVMPEHWQKVAPQMDISPLDLSLIIPAEGSGCAYLRYRTQAFHRLTVKLFAANITSILKTIIHQIQAAVSRILISPYPLELPHKCKSSLIHQCFEGHVESDPNAIAFYFENRFYSYQEINFRANCLAAWICQNHPIQSTIGLYMTRHVDTVITLLAILKAGCIYVPLDPTHPVKRRNLIIRDAQLKCIMVSPSMKDDLPPQIPQLDPHPFIKNPHITAADLPRIPTTAIACIRFESRASGSPIGIAQTHDMLFHNFSAIAQTIKFDSADCLASVTNLSNPGADLEFLMPLIKGASLLLIPRHLAMQGPALRDTLQRHPVTTLHATSFIWNRLLTANWRKNIKALCFGERVSKDLLNQFEEAQIKPWNLYSESLFPSAAFIRSIHSSHQDSELGRPLPHIQAVILNQEGNPVPDGIPGRLCLTTQASFGYYHNSPQLTALSLSVHPTKKGLRLLYTNKIARCNPSGHIHILSHNMRITTLGGHTCDLRDIENHLCRYKSIQKAHVSLHKPTPEKEILLAYIVQVHDDISDTPYILENLRGKLPAYMIPQALIPMVHLPYDLKGNIIESQLPIPREANLNQSPSHTPPQTIEATTIAHQWKKRLGHADLGIYDNFFKLGGDRWQLLEAYKELPPIIRAFVSLESFYKKPTIAHITAQLSPNTTSTSCPTNSGLEARRKLARLAQEQPGEKIAIIGMACRFPKAPHPQDFWQNLVRGQTAVQRFSSEALLEEGESRERIENPTYLPFRAVLEDYQNFDASFFGFTPREAQITDPQQRLFLECAWEALESAGYAPQHTHHTVGIFGGVGLNHYLAGHLLPNPQLSQQVGELPLMIGNGVDNLCSRVSFKLGLTGPGVVVQTNCSTSLVAVHLASQALNHGECTMALAGAVDLGELRRVGYLHEEGLGLAKTGTTHPFDAAASGSVPGQGAGMVLLKRLQDAIEDGDHIHAVIRGHAVNNDGAHKQSYTSFALDGQVGVLKEALNNAQLDPQEIQYIETSSSASPNGDQVELSGLRQAYGEKHPHPVALGAVKSSAGNLGIASGMCALLKAILTLENALIPPTLHHHQPHPKLNLHETSYYINSRPRPFPKKDPKAAVSSFGMGGTNAHLILEKAPPTANYKTNRLAHLICLSAKTPQSLNQIAADLAESITKNPMTNLADIAFTLSVRNNNFPYRRMYVATNNANLVLQLQNQDTRYEAPTHCVTTHPDLTFLYPGFGVHYKRLAQDLLERESRFNESVERCKALLFRNLRQLASQIFNAEDHHYSSERMALELFIFQYALTRTLEDYGITPGLLMADRFGMLIAATIADVFDLAHALEIVVIRARAHHAMEKHSHLAVTLCESRLTSHLEPELHLDTVLSKNQVLVSGPVHAIQRFKNHLKRSRISYQDMYQSPFAYLPQNSQTLKPYIENVILRPPQIPILCPHSGKPVSEEQATNPNYWVELLSQPYRPNRALEPILGHPHRTLLEIAPSQLLVNLARRHPAMRPGHDVFTAMHPPSHQEPDSYIFMKTLGRLWLNGFHIDGETLHSEYPGKRIPLPTYPFEREPYWVPKYSSPQTNHLQSDELTQHPMEKPHSPFRPGVLKPYESPKTQLQKRLSRQIGDLLGLKTIGIYDNFFELGGDSFLALNLTNRLTQAYQVLITAQVLLKNPSIDDLAKYIQAHKSHSQDNLQSTNPLVQLQKGDAEAPTLFLMHPVGGEVYFYRGLANHLSPKLTIYGVQATSLGGFTEPYTDLRAQAKNYLQAIKSIQPTGPYHLGGASYGGVLAFEMAQQLYHEGQTVPLLALIDAPAPGKMPTRLHSSAQILHYLLGKTLRLDLETMETFDSDEALLAWISEQARQNQATSALPSHLGKSMLKTWMAHQEALHHYRPQSYFGDTLFFSATQRSPMNPTEMHKAWKPLIKGHLTCIPVPGNHITMNHHRNVPVIARQIQKELDRSGLLLSPN